LCSVEDIAKQLRPGELGHFSRRFHYSLEDMQPGCAERCALIIAELFKLLAQKMPSLRSKQSDGIVIIRALALS